MMKTQDLHDLVENLNDMACEYSSAVNAIRGLEAQAAKKMTEHKSRVHAAMPASDQDNYDTRKKALYADPEYNYWAGQRNAISRCLAFLEGRDGE